MDQTLFTFSHYTLMGLYDASECRTDGIQKKSLSAASTSSTILLPLKGHAESTGMGDL